MGWKGLWSWRQERLKERAGFWLSWTAKERHHASSAQHCCAVLRGWRQTCRYAWSWRTRSGNVGILPQSLRCRVTEVYKRILRRPTTRSRSAARRNGSLAIWREADAIPNRLTSLSSRRALIWRPRGRCRRFQNFAAMYVVWSSRFGCGFRLRLVPHGDVGYRFGSVISRGRRTELSVTPCGPLHKRKAAECPYRSHISERTSFARWCAPLDKIS